VNALPNISLMTPGQKDAASDLFHLERFVQAQQSCYFQVLHELRRCRKESHWMWFIFPQIQGLGRSSTAEFYAIKSSAEAGAYLDHPVLGPRLLECAETILRCAGKSAEAIFGFPDHLKLRSSMTLFASVSEPNSIFKRVLARYFDGQLDERTIELLKTKARGA